MKKLIIFELILLIFFGSIIFRDWNKPSLTRDYFSILICGEIILDLYFRLKEKK